MSITKSLHGRKLQLNCTSCGNRVSRRYRFCPYCGETVDVQKLYNAARERLSQEKQQGLAGLKDRQRHRDQRRMLTRLVRKAKDRANHLAKSTKYLLAVLVALFMASAAWAYFIEPNWVELSQIEISLKDLPPQLEGFTIVQISDTHIEYLGRREMRAIKMCNDAKPDVIALTGDYTGGAWGERTDSSSWEVARFVRRLKAERAIFAVWGDWDYNEILRNRMRNAGVIGLFNDGRTLDVDGAALSFLGLGLNIIDLQGALETVKPDSVKILLCHEAMPQSVDDAAGAGIDLVLIGGEHGGQVCLPMLGPLRPAPYYGRRYMRGLHLINDSMYLYANRGLGMSNFPFRFLCRPEVAVIKLKRA